MTPENRALQDPWPTPPKVTLEPRPGDHIAEVVRRACEMATLLYLRVWFEFNGIFVQVSPGDSPERVLERWQAGVNFAAGEYRKSPEGRRAALDAARRLTDMQERTNRAIGVLPAIVHSMDDLIRWAVELSESADHVDVSWDARAVADVIEAAGWKRNAEVGREPEAFLDRATVGRYIIGQVIDCLRMGMPPRQTIRKLLSNIRVCSSSYSSPEKS